MMVKKKKGGKVGELIPSNNSCQKYKPKNIAPQVQIRKFFASKQVKINMDFQKLQRII